MEKSIFGDSVRINGIVYGKINSEKDGVQVLIPEIQGEVARRFGWGRSLVQKHKITHPSDIDDIEFRMKK